MSSGFSQSLRFLRFSSSSLARLLWMADEFGTGKGVAGSPSREPMGKSDRKVLWTSSSNCFRLSFLLANWLRLVDTSSLFGSEKRIARLSNGSPALASKDNRPFSASSVARARSALRFEARKLMTANVTLADFRRIVKEQNAGA